MKSTKTSINTANAVLGSTTGALSVTIVLGFVLWSAMSMPADELGLTLILAFACLALIACLTLLLMALRKFGAQEADAASKIVAKANAFGFAGLLLVLASLAIKIKDAVVSLAFLAASAATFAWLYSFGKNNFKYR